MQNTKQSTSTTKTLKTPLILPEHFADAKAPVDVKADPAPKTVVQGTALKNILRTARKGKGLSPVRTMLWFVSQASSASGAALATNVPIDLAAIPEVAASWAGVFDEAKVHRVVCRYRFADSAAVAAARWAVVCFDPLDGTALSTLANGLEASQHRLTGLNPSGTAGSASTSVSPLVSNSDGLHTFLANVQSVAGFNVAGNEVPGQWHPIATAMTNYDGQLKVYVEGASGNVVTWEYCIGVDVSFRSRA